MKSLVQICFLLFPLIVYAQNFPLDSLLKVSRNGTVIQKVQAANRLFDYYLYNDPKHAYNYNEQLLKLSRKLSDADRYYAWYLQNASKYFIQQNQLYRAMDSINKAITIQKQNRLEAELPDSYKILAGIYYYLGDLEKAVEISYKGLELLEKQKNIQGMVSVLSNIGLLNISLENLEEAKNDLHRALKLIHQYKLNVSPAYIYGNLGLVYKYKSQIDSATYYYRLALSEAQKHNDKNGMVKDLVNLANIYAFYEYRPDSAEYYFNRALYLARQVDKYSVPTIQANRAKMLLEHGQFSQGIPLMKQALSLARKSGNKKDRELAYYMLYKSYKKLGQYDKALPYLENLMDLQDTLREDQAKITIANLEAKYQNQKKQAKIEKLELRRHLDRKIRIYLMVIMAFMLISFLLLSRNLYVSRKRALLQQQLLQSEKDRLDQMNKYKTRQLTTQTLMIMQKNKLLDDLLNQLSQLRNKQLTGRELNKISRKLRQALQSEKDWELFKHYFEEINTDFFEKLKKLNPDLTPSERKLSALIKLGFSIKETASLLNLSPDSVKTSRHLLRKKLGLRKSQNLYQFLNNL